MALHGHGSHNMQGGLVTPIVVGDLVRIKLPCGHTAEVVSVKANVTSEQLWYLWACWCAILNHIPSEGA